MPILIPAELPQPIRAPVSPLPANAFTASAATDANRRRRQFEGLQKIIGTGGSYRAVVSAPGMGTSAGWVVHDVRKVGDAAPSTPEMMRAIKKDLLPQITDLATVLGVRRPTIYAWINGEQEPSPERLDRIREIYSVVWNAGILFKSIDRKSLDVALIQSPLAQLLKDLKPTDFRIQTELESVAVQANQRAGKRAADKGFDILAAARAMGREMQPNADTRLQADIITGKGYDLEVEES